ncbi:MAG TPA: endonuclease/exonuclease/phosphatase family protein [Vicinamibacterales bacterium]|nr:endonuclease/exonuclease/phosphatase family protein [Vicinamibacterales bacterium]
MMGHQFTTAARRAIATTAACVLLMVLPARAQSPAPASNPSPANGAVGVAVGVTLSWSAGSDARRFDVRLGTTPSPPVVARNLTTAAYQPPSPLTAGTTYYWRIDVRGRGSSITEGPLWSFTTAAAPTPPPSAPASPSPVNGATSVGVTTAVSWAASSNATSYTVAFGTSSTPPVVSSGQTGTTYDPPGDLTASTTHFWRVTATGPGGSTAGPLWSFTTAAAPPPPPSTSLDRLRLMTWNVQHGLNAAKTKAVDAQVELMADSGAHVIVLQEVTINADGDLPALYQSKLQTLTGVSWNAVWAPVRDTSTPEGNLILTRLPVASSATIKIDSDPGDPTFLDAKRSAAQVAVIVNGVRVNVVTTHLALSATHRQAQLDMLQTWVASIPAPRLLGGDFNFVQGESAYADMAGGFTDAWPVLAGTDPGYTMDVRTLSPQPGRIDYWWQEKTDASARVTEIWVLKTRRSDHHAVVVDVEVK